MINELIERYPALYESREDILAVRDIIIKCFEGGGKLLLCGNGGSCADCDHITGELMKGFLKKRPLGAHLRASMKDRCPEINDATLDRLQRALPAISLPSLTALNSAFCNDVDPELVYAQGVLALGKEGDVLLAISTSGNSVNVIEGARVANALGLTVISLTGRGGGMLKGLSHASISVPEGETYKAQELHLPIYHYLCAEVERHFFA